MSSSHHRYIFPSFWKISITRHFGFLPIILLIKYEVVIHRGFIYLELLQYHFPISGNTGDLKLQQKGNAPLSISRTMLRNSSLQ